MNCRHVRDQLPALLYGDLPPDEVAGVQTHLQACRACRQEELVLRQVRRLLDTLPTPDVSVNLAQLYRQAAERQQRRVRRWRRAAVLSFAAAAAVVVLAVRPRFEVRLGEHQLVLRWANPPPTEPPAPVPVPPALAQAPPPPRSEPGLLPQMQEQVQVLGELVQGQREDMARLQAQVNDLRRQVVAGTQRWLTTERDVAALSGSRFLQPKKGDLHE
jgi:hypothetical protein